MRLDDPSRPFIGTRPAYVDPSGRPVGTISPWILYPAEPGQVYLNIFLMTRHGVATNFQLTFPLVEFTALYTEWELDVELWYITRLGWQWKGKEKIPPPPPAGKSPPAKSNISLADIGL